MPKRNTQSENDRSQANRRTQASQRTINKSQVSAEDFETYINNCVRYFIYRAGSNIPIRKTDIQKDALPRAGKNYERIMTRVKKILDKVYGYQLQICEETAATKTYILTTDLFRHGIDNEDDEVPKDTHKVLVMLVLAHVFMSNNSANETSLFSFLKLLNVDVEKRHVIFGDVKNFINVVMAKQKYLYIENDPKSRKNTYSWGPRAENTVSKVKLLSFVCKIYKDKQPKSFSRQFDAANQQILANDENEDAENTEESLTEADDE